MKFFEALEYLTDETLLTMAREFIAAEKNSPEVADDLSDYTEAIRDELHARVGDASTVEQMIANR